MEPRIGWGATAEFAVLMIPARMSFAYCVSVRVALYIDCSVG